MPMRIFGPSREEVVGDWRRLHNEELLNFHALPNTVREIKRRMRYGTCSTQGGDEKCNNEEITRKTYAYMAG
jgi:hypothetical protein